MKDYSYFYNCWIELKDNKKYIVLGFRNGNAGLNKIYYRSDKLYDFLKQDSYNGLELSHLIDICNKEIPKDVYPRKNQIVFPIKYKIIDYIRTTIRNIAIKLLELDNSFIVVK